MIRSTSAVSTVTAVLLGFASAAVGEVIVRRGDDTLGRTNSTSDSERHVLAQKSSQARRRSGDTRRVKQVHVSARSASKREAAALQSTLAPSPLAGLPANDSCSSPEAIAGEGVFPFNNADATSDDLPHDECKDDLDPVGLITHDVWFCWTAECTGPVDVTTCGLSDVDTKIAVYKSCEMPDGGANCPPSGDDLFPFSCNDDAEGFDRCGIQSGATILAVEGERYLIRVGTYPGNADVDPPDLPIPPAPGGPGSLQITCVDLPCSNADSEGNCQDYHRFSGTGSNGVDFRVADDFTATETGAITELCWWGSYIGDVYTPGFNPDEFEIRYFADEGGVPGALIGGPFKQADGTLEVSAAIDTGAGQVFRVFEYSATHGGACSVSGSACLINDAPCSDLCTLSGAVCSVDADCTEDGDACGVIQICEPEGVPVAQDDCYWIEIANDTDPNAWFWQDGVGGDIASLQDGDDVNVPDGYDATDVIPNDLAFCLDVSNASCHESPCAGATGDCCEFGPISTPGCQEPECCERVCGCDPACCSDSGWDEFCQGSGFANTGCGAADLCVDTCASCPDGTVAFQDPLVDPARYPDGLVDARQTSPIAGGGASQGFQSFFVEAPLNASTAILSGCWSLCETGDTGTANRIDRILSHADGTYTINLLRPITAGEVTTLTYTSDTGVIVSERFASLPGDTNSDRLVNTADINNLIDCINHATPAPCDEWQADIDRSSVTNAQDTLRVIDLLNGAGDFDVWLAATVGTECPAP